MKVLLVVLITGFCAPALLSGVHHIVIDAGHGGGSYAGSQKARTLSTPNNATSPSGLKEKNLTLKLAIEVKKQIKALAKKHPGTKINCVLTRSTDKNLDFATRASICAKARPSAIISLHFNASPGHNALGTLTLVNHRGRNPNYAADRAFAWGLTQATSLAVQKFLPASHARDPMTDKHLHKGAGSNFFYQLARYPELNKTPRCFLEVEFIDRVDVDKALLMNRERSFPVIARAIALYLYKYCATR